MFGFHVQFQQSFHVTKLDVHLRGITMLQGNEYDKKCNQLDINLLT